MTCNKCGKDLAPLSWHYVPCGTADGYRLCLECEKNEKIVTLV
ncbi:MAG: hypothetical protein ACRCUT_13720 [Spirochaetota bacterium]